ncbi:MAG: hypothetical protein JSU95_02420 [Betaproteobacteria bacterium]|nr:MAG: hypothetical protein JSU95_02420 [Betaproteobacteria bacterium]
MKTIATLANRFTAIFSFNASATNALPSTAEGDDSGSDWYMYGIGSI